MPIALNGSQPCLVVRLLLVPSKSPIFVEGHDWSTSASQMSVKPTQFLVKSGEDLRIIGTSTVEAEISIRISYSYHDSFLKPLPIYFPSIFPQRI